MLLIETSKGVITKNKTIITEVSKYALSKDALLIYTLGASNSKDLQMKMIYRRFIRLAPFISQKQTIRSRYIDYLKLKFDKKFTNLQSEKVEQSNQAEMLHPDAMVSLRSLHLTQLLLSDNRDVVSFGKRLLNNIIEKKVLAFGKGHNRTNKSTKSQTAELFDYTLSLFNQRNDVNF